MRAIVRYLSGAASLGLHMTMPCTQGSLNSTKRRCTTVSWV